MEKIEQNQMIQNQPHKRNPLVYWLFALIIVLITTLPFHYFPNRLMIFPKNTLTFSYTFITENDIKNIIDRYNTASLVEKQAMSNEPLIRKLIEKGILIKNKPEVTNSTDEEEQNINNLKFHSDGNGTASIKLYLKDNNTFYFYFKSLTADEEPLEEIGSWIKSGNECELQFPNSNLKLTANSFFDDKNYFTVIDDKTVRFKLNSKELYIYGVLCIKE
jgi:hypothetical protein